MPRYTLDKLSEKTAYKPSDYRKSQAWFAEQAKKLGNMVSPNSAMSTQGRSRATFIPGRMYLFQYFPIGAADLPYYDVLPLIIPFSADEKTFTGLNFHYLPYKVRYTLLRNLLDFATNKKMDEKTRLQLSWSYIKGVSKYAGIQSAVKRYRVDQMQSHFVEIKPEEWFMTLLLPIERFNTGENRVYINKEFVWQQERKFW